MDYVRFKDKCPNCGARFKEFQSKDDECRLKTIPFTRVQNFYTGCDKCGAWIDYEVKSIFPTVERKVRLKDADRYDYTTDIIEVTPDFMQQFDNDECRECDCPCHKDNEECEECRANDIDSDHPEDDDNPEYYGYDEDDNNEDQKNND